MLYIGQVDSSEDGQNLEGLDRKKSKKNKKKKNNNNKKHCNIRWVFGDY